MTPEAILSTCARLGVTLRTSEGTLVARPSGVLTADLRAAIRARRAELLALLTTAPPEGRHHVGLATFDKTAPDDSPERPKTPIDREGRQALPEDRHDSEDRQHDDAATFGSIDPDALDERAAIVEANAVPREWAEGFARLDTMPRPPSWALWRWSLLVDDAGRFLDVWGAEAAAMGWHVLDVFGVNAVAPTARLDQAGLVMLIEGGEVILVTPSGAVIRTATGATLTYRRRPPLEPGQAGIWDLQPGTLRQRAR